ncbi:hypothetical protein [Aquella oligotrophica]|uniref:Uncharacterized protein n=1 Tax=Aquella oligotrophica TaxID=2067065 RepID=A0A2I7N7U9_9NEIS|nr:hypothetical protein [Aquella oligotrophica]AUR52539.1 hypothetical protein CUN60_09590 [Aquella oligotrophica]
MKTLKFQKFRYFITENHTLLNENQSKDEFLSKIFKARYKFEYYGNSYEYTFRYFSDSLNVVLGTIGRYSEHPYYDDTLARNTNNEYEFAFVIINLNHSVEVDKNAQNIYLQCNKGLSTNVYSLLKALAGKINNNEDHKIFINPENLAKDHFWDAIEGHLVTKLIITYAPKNLFSHKALTDLSKELAENMNAQETKIVIENSSASSTGLELNNKNSHKFMEEVLDDTSKGAASLKVYSKRSTCYNSESNNEIIERSVEIFSDNLTNESTIVNIVTELFSRD